MSEWLWWTLAWAEPAILLAYLTLFLFRRDTSLRPRPLALIGCLGVAAQLGFVAEELPAPPSSSVVLLLVRLILVGVLGSVSSVALVRARADTVRAELMEACRRLFIAANEVQPGALALTTKQIGMLLRMWAMGPVTLISFPRPPVEGKLTLLHDWLRKRYPGPIPRIRVSLLKR